MTFAPPGVIPRHWPYRQQRGVALYVALIILVVLTVIGIALLGNTSLQTKMAYSAAERQFAFASAESALAAGEDWLEAQITKPIADCTSNCSNGVSIWPRAGLATPRVTAAEYKDETWWANNGRKYGFSYVEGVVPAAVAGQAIIGSHQPPRYIIEDLGADPTGSLVVGQGVNFQTYYFQITARGFGAQSNAQTLVQSVYAKGF
jgi:type IV pilus assembly protein PilX